MNARKHHIANVVATGVVVILLVSTALFWARWLCRIGRDRLLPQSARIAMVDLSPLLEPVAGDPNRAAPLRIGARIPQNSPLLVGLGIRQYLESRLPTGPSSPIYRWELQGPDGLCRYYDSSLGQIVSKGKEISRRADGTTTVQSFSYFAGPEGVGETSEEKLGRFLAPIADRLATQPQIVYDRAVRRFYAIDWSRGVVRKGPELANNGMHEPVQIRVLLRNPDKIPLISVPTSPREDRLNKVLSLPTYFPGTGSVAILDASGRIDLLDPGTLEFTGVAGRLPKPMAVLGALRPTRPQDVIAYEVSPFNILRGDGSEEWRYGGCAVAALSREGIDLRLEVYDANGSLFGLDETGVPRYVEAAHARGATKGSVASVWAAYFYLPGAQTLTLAQFTLENLHPPVFLLLSYLAAPHLDARAGYRSLFLLPDSFVAMRARDVDSGVVARPASALLLACPALLFVLLLAWFVTRDAARMGLSKDARAAWIAGTVIFGLPAYIAYRLTRPKVALVTCANCGLGRRPDMDKCHRCGSSWVVPELTPPAWRVLGEPEQAEESSPSPAQQASSQAQ